MRLLSSKLYILYQAFRLNPEVTGKPTQQIVNSGVKFLHFRKMG